MKRFLRRHVYPSIITSKYFISSRSAHTQNLELVPTVKATEFASTGQAVSSTDLPASVDVGELQTMPASRLRFKELCGPWLIMSDTLKGELLISEDNFVTLRPPPQTNECTLLCNCVGKIHVSEEETSALEGLPEGTPSTVTVFRIDLEMYEYDRKSPHSPPFKPTNVVLTGVFSAAISEKANYKTLTMTGSINGSDQPKLGETTDALFHAAKLVPWDDKDQQATVWRPKKDVHDSFEMLFVHLPLDVSSHLERAKSSPRKEGPKHLDLAQYKVGEIPSIYYIPNYISSTEESQILRHLKETPESLKTKLPKRLCQEWGGTLCDQCNQSFLSDVSMPPWTKKVSDMLLFDGIFTPTTFPNSVRVHEYDQFEGIGPHCDGPIYVPLVAVLSLASTSVMHFYPRRAPYEHEITEHYNDTFKFSEGEIGKQTPIASVIMEPGSLLVFTEEAFTHYPHGVSDKAVDDLRGANCVNRHLLRDPNLTLVERKYRASATIRNLLPRCGHSPERNEFMMRHAWQHYNQQSTKLEIEWDTSSSLPAQKSLPSSLKLEPLANHNAPSLDGGKVDRINDLYNLCNSIATTQAQLVKDVADIKLGIEELKSVVGFTFTSSTSYQKESSSILNHLSMAVMDIGNKHEESSEELQNLKDSIGQFFSEKK